MKNINKYTKEELLENLPDYLSGDITDNKINNGISELIETDPDFRNQYEEIKLSLNFLENSNTVEVPEYYFNNLSVKINERINNEILSENNKGLLPQFRNLWKILIPALTVIIVALFILFRFQNPDKSVTLNENIPGVEMDNIQTMDSENIEDNNNSEKNSKESAAENKTENSNADTEQKTNHLKLENGIKIENSFSEKSGSKELKRIMISESSKSNGGISTQEELRNEIAESEISDLYDIAENDSENSGDNDEIEIFISSGGEDSNNNIQEDFRELTPAEQQEILNILIKTQI